MSVIAIPQLNIRENTIAPQLQFLSSAVAIFSAVRNLKSVTLQKNVAPQLPIHTSTIRSVVRHITEARSKTAEIYFIIIVES